MTKLKRKRGQPPPADVLYAVDDKRPPEESWCLNVMCRAKFWRKFGESEFCPACRKMLRKP